MNVLVIDVGTSSMRGILYNEQGCALYSHQVSYQVQYISEIIVEQNSNDFEKTLIEILRNLVSYSQQNNYSIDALSLTSQRSSIIPVDYKGTPLRNAIMWMDKRNESICNELQEKTHFIFQKTGAKPNTVFSGSKMTWLKRNEPEIYNHTYKLLTIADYLAFLITGEFKTDYTYGGRSLLMNLCTFDWDDELLSLFEIDRDKLCPLIAPGEILGLVTPEFAMKTGLRQGIPYITAGGDQQCAALGHGVIQKGIAEITTGTGAFILSHSDEVPITLDSNVICGPHVIAGKYVLESSILTCSSLYNWCADTFFEFKDNNKYDIHHVNELVNASPIGSNGCIVLPFFQGRGTPDWNSGATGTFLNVTLNTHKQDLIRATLEAIAMEIANNINILENYTGKITKIYLGGGLSNFSTFNQIQSDIYKKILLHSSNHEQTAIGAFVNAAVTLNLFKNYKEALQCVQNHESFETYTPNPDSYSIYDQIHKLSVEYYNKLYKNTI